MLLAWAFSLGSLKPSTVPELLLNLAWSRLADVASLALNIIEMYCVPAGSVTPCKQ